MKRRPDLLYFLTMAGRSFNSACVSSIVYLVISYFFVNYCLDAGDDKLIEIAVSFGTILVLVIVMLASAFNLTVASPSFSDYDERIVMGRFRGFDRASILFRRGMSRLAESHMAAALELFRNVDEYKLNTNEQAVLYYYTGVCYRNMGYPSNGASYFMKSVDCVMAHPDAMMNALRCYARAGNINDAEDVFSAMKEKNYLRDYYSFLYTEMGMMYIRADRPDDAIERFNTGIGLGLDRPSALGGIAISYMLKGDIEQSRSYFRKAVIGNIPDIEGFRDYYITIARGCGHFSEVSDFLDEKQENN